MNTQNPHFRRIKSFVRRDSRMTFAQKRAFSEQWPRFGLDPKAGLIEFQAPRRIIEIGFGSGTSLLAMAKAHLETEFIGIETHQPGIGNLLLHMNAENVTNIRIYYADAVEVLKQCIPADSIDTIQIFFPDPWPKRRHHKRRLIQPEFVDLIIDKLKPSGTLHLASDWEHYAEHMMKVLSANERIENSAGPGHYSPRSIHRPTITKFEQRGETAGHRISELQFVKR